MAQFDLDRLFEATGWADLDLSTDAELTPEQREQRQRQLEVCDHYRATFEGDEQGRFVLRDLMQTFMVPHVAEPGDDMLAVGIRQGEQNVVRRILHFMYLSRTGGQGADQ